MAMPKAFEKRFGIKMEYNALKGRELASRLRTERAAGIFSADAVIAGAGSSFTVIAKRGKISNGVMGFAAPLRLVLILPEVIDTSKYFGNKLWFMDPSGKYLLRLSYRVSHTLFLKTKYEKPSELKSWTDLMDKAPNPNAAKVFVNWITSREGLAVYSRSAREFPVRRDVDRSKFPKYLVPQDGVKYGDLQNWDSSRKVQPKVKKLMKKILRKRK